MKCIVKPFLIAILFVLFIGRAAVTVQAAVPSNDLFVDAEAVVGSAGSVPGSNISATDEENEPDHYNGVYHSVWYQWTASSDDPVRFDTYGSDFDTVMAVYTGTDLAALILIASNDDSNGVQSSILFTPVSETTYYIAVDGYSSSNVGNISFNWRLITSPANDMFANAEILSGTDGTVSEVNILATPETNEPDHLNGVHHSIWYQWTASSDDAVKFDTYGSDFDTVMAVYTGSDFATLILIASNDNSNGNQSSISFTPASETTYYIAVDGYSSSDVGNISFNWMIPPANDMFADAQVLPVTDGTVFGSNINATVEDEEPDNWDNSPSVWYKWTAPSSTPIEFDTHGSDFNTLMRIYTGNALVNLGQISANDDDCLAGGISSRIAFTPSAGMSYYIIIYSSEFSASGNIQLNWRTMSTPANDMFANAEPLIGIPGTVFSNNRDAFREGGEPEHAVQELFAMHSVWYQWTATSSTPVMFDTLGSDFNTVMAVYVGTILYDDMTVTASNGDDPMGGYHSRVSFTPETGTTYFIAIDGYGCPDVGNIRLNWRLLEPPSNDMFTNAELLSADNGSILGSTIDATIERNEPDHVSTPYHSAWYQWTSSTGLPVYFDTQGSDYDTVIAVYSGNSLENLRQIASNDDDGVSVLSRVDLAPFAETTYYIAVDGYSASDFGSITLNWGIPAPPENDLFVNAEQLTGSSGSLIGTTVGATAESGEPSPLGPAHSSIWYQWTAASANPIEFNTRWSNVDTVLVVYSGSSLDDLVQITRNNDEYIQGESTSASKVSFRPITGTTYHIAIDLYSDSRPGNISLNWQEANPPENDMFADARQLVGSSGTVTGTTVDATAETAEPVFLDWPHHSVWYQWTTASTVPIEFATQGSDFDTVLAVYTGSDIENLTRVAGNDDYGGSTSRVSFTPAAGMTYYIAVDGGGTSDYGNINLNWMGPIPPTNDMFSAAAVLSGSSGTVSGSNIDATDEVNEPSHINPANYSVWYQWTAPNGERVRFDTFGSDFDTIIAVYTGNTLDSLTQIVSNDDYPYAMDMEDQESEVYFIPVNGTTYYIAIDGSGDADIGNITLNYQPRPLGTFHTISGTVRLPGVATAPSNISLTVFAGWEDVSVTIPEGGSSGTYLLNIPDSVSTPQTVGYIVYSGSWYINDGYYASTGTVRYSDDATLLAADEDHTGIDITLSVSESFENNLAGTVSLPSGTAPTSGIDVDVIAVSANGEIVLPVFIPGGGRSTPFSIAIPNHPPLLWEVYYSHSGSDYLPIGYYSTSGTTSNPDNSTLLAGWYDQTDINLKLIGLSENKFFWPMFLPVLTTINPDNN